MSVDDLFSSLEKQRKCVIKYRDKMHNEEHTKMGFILPFFKVLGYNMLAPDEVIAEYSCDFGTKKGEKVDFAIMKEGDPIILIEAKHCDKVLDERFASQLSRYFNQTDVKLGILTNGIQYWFYSDFDKVNIMDSEPFYKFDILNFTEEDVAKLHNFTKDVFLSDEEVLTNWRLNGVVNLYHEWLEEQMTRPSKDFLQLFCSSLSYKVNVDDLQKILEEDGTVLKVDAKALEIGYKVDSKVPEVRGTEQKDSDFSNTDVDEVRKRTAELLTERINQRKPQNEESKSEESIRAHKDELVVVTATKDSLYKDFRLKYLRDDIVDLAGRCDHYYVAKNDASYVVKYNGMTFDFLCAKNASKVNITYKNIYGVLIDNTVYRIFTWSALMAVVVEYLLSKGYTKEDIVFSDVHDKRVLYVAEEFKYFTSKAEYKGITFNKNISAICSMKTFINLLNLFKMDLSKIYVIMYDFGTNGSSKDSRLVDSVGNLVEVKDVVLK